MITTRKTRYSDMPGGGVCQCMNHDSPIICGDCPSRQTPTDEGRRRYPDGRYDGVACVCYATCDDPCKGGEPCTCGACSNRYYDVTEGPQAEA